MATLEIINIGAAPNDGEGYPLRTAFQKVNNNFATMWSTGFNTTEAITFGNTTQEIFSVPVTAFTQATFQINSYDANTTNSQNIVINAALSNDSNTVRFTGHSTTFFDTPVTQYSMDVVDGTVYLYADPFVTGQLNHFIAYQVTFNPLLAGSYLVLTQNPSAALGTENLQIITTES